MIVCALAVPSRLHHEDSSRSELHFLRPGTDYSTGRGKTGEIDAPIDISSEVEILCTWLI